MKFTSIVMAGFLSVATLHAAETTETVTLSGTTVKLTGNLVSVGDDAPQVKLVDSNLKDVTVGGKTEKTQVLVVIPSIDTPVCNIEAGKFNEKAAAMPNVEMTVISMDLPFASQRYCAAHGIKNITIASDFRSKEFGKTYGTLIADSALEGIETRAVFIIKNGKVTYKQLVREITTEPDYDAVLKAI